MKNFFIVLSVFFCINVFAEVSKEQCASKGEEYIFAGGECIEFVENEGDIEGSLIIIVHGTWDAGTNTLGRYAPFGETLTMATDITSVAVALPGYSGSSTNNLQSLVHNGAKNQAARKEYVDFLGELVLALKTKYKATKVTYVGHSAGAMMGATLTGFKPELINNMVAAGGRYDIHEVSDNKELVSIIDVMDKVKNTKFLLIYGTADKISKPKVTKEFYKIAKAKSFDVKIVEVKDAVHIDLDMTDTSIEAITELLED